MLKHCALIIAVAAGASLLAGCETTVVPLRPVRTIEVDAQPFVAVAATLPTTTTATAPAETQAAATAASEPATSLAATAPATAPAAPHKITKTINPNEISRFVYDARYDRVWQQAQQLLEHMGLRIDRHDYRLGILTTFAQPSAQIVEPWRRDQAGFMHALENTVNAQQRTVHLTISTVPEKPDFYKIAVQVLVERQSNPSEVMGGEIFVEGSGFGRSPVTLRSDYTGSSTEGRPWVLIGHDPALETKILDELFKRI